MAQANVYDKLKELGVELPTAGAPAAAYVMAAQSGNTVYLSGHIAKKDGKPWAGKLGDNLSTEDGKAAAPKSNIPGFPAGNSKGKTAKGAVKNTRLTGGSQRGS